MAQVNLVFTRTQTSIATQPGGSAATQLDALTLDATPTESHTADAETTDSPVEVGADVTDHYRPKPRTLTMEAIVSDVPSPAPGASTGAAPDPTRPGQAYRTLLHIRQTAALLTVATAIETYENMMLTHVGVPRKVQDGGSLRVQLEFKEIQVVASQTVAVARSLPKAKPTADKGKLAAQPIPKSWAAGAADGLASSLGNPAMFGGM